MRPVEVFILRKISVSQLSVLELSLQTYVVSEFDVISMHDLHDMDVCICNVTFFLHMPARVPPVPGRTSTSQGAVELRKSTYFLSPPFISAVELFRSGGLSEGPLQKIAEERERERAVFSLDQRVTSASLVSCPVNRAAHTS